MPNTLNHDEFMDEPIKHNYEPYSILYGAKGWTDEIDAVTIAMLERMGAIRLYKTISGVGFETRIYVSVKGVEPK